MKPRRWWFGLLFLGLFVPPTAGAEFGYLKVKGGPTTGNQPYGAVTIITPFASETDGAVPLWLLVDSGDFSKPWLRAKHVARLLPKVVELILYRGEVLKVGPDEEGDPSIFVGPPSRPVTKTDLKVVSVLPADRDRFERERSENRKLSRTAVAHYWKALIEDSVEIFVRYPLARDHRVLHRMKLTKTRSGAIYKRILVEVGILLKFDDITEDKATTEVLRAKLVETLQGLGRDRWSQLTRLAFSIPEDFPLPAGEDPAAPGPRSSSDDAPPVIEGALPRQEAEVPALAKVEDPPEAEGRGGGTAQSMESSSPVASGRSSMRRPWD